VLLPQSRQSSVGVGVGCWRIKVFGGDNGGHSCVGVVCWRVKVFGGGNGGVDCWRIFGGGLGFSME